MSDFEVLETVECARCGATADIFEQEITRETLETGGWLFVGAHRETAYCEDCHEEMYPEGFEEDEDSEQTGLER